MNLTGTVRSDEELAAWVARRGLSGVTRLVLWNGGITDAGAEALARDPDAAALEVLDLSWNRIGSRGARAIARSSSLAGLRSLRLYHNDVGPDGAEAVAGGCFRLASLNLCGNGLGADGASRLAGARALPGLRALHLGWDDLRDEGAEALAEGEWPELVELNVRANEIGPRGARALLDGAFPALRWLALDDNPCVEGAVPWMSAEGKDRWRPGR